MSDPIAATTACFNPDMAFPGPGVPGLSNFAVGVVASTLAGVGFVLKYLPPSPTNLPSLPSLSLFLDPFMGAIKVPGLTIPAPPGVPSATIAASAAAVLKFVMATVTMIFGLFTGIVTSIINLSPKLPGIDLAISAFSASLGQFGLLGPNGQPNFPIQCIPMTVINLIKSGIPV